MAYILCPLTSGHMHVLYEWRLHEQNFDYYTCRPVHDLPTETEFIEKLEKDIIQQIRQIFVIVDDQEISKPFGRITLFDFNPRNHSAEFGYYIPAEFRGKGIGQNMVRLLLEKVFDQENNLNKVCATTSSNNLPSIKLLERNGFKLDGRLREHYWIRGIRYDQLHYSMLRSD
ncbi:acetyltransferase, ribosomal protein N-acetylase [Desulfosporosinus acidiphilus SJ4]|uniref:Acetyltransferase, ribosomal protein N-acetylase n=1 Tax=Desulfosporosinus acidiphilus (strain DSM 22704 / JCM 16185 / SJ4) TaxID=646529 RepID=I4D3R8_DESAJ|nr:GNAT family protein [Desulfosporosinus acidiphilus]AFM40442.1 acetyltransferase, ribosomal protein N-acetylase [Desulfosporosinus acidiphilus SJ4]